MPTFTPDSKVHENRKLLAALLTALSLRQQGGGIWGADPEIPGSEGPCGVEGQCALAKGAEYLL